MRVSIYIALSRLLISSGVPRHIKEIVSRLIKSPHMDITFFVNKAEGMRYLPLQGDAWSNASRITFKLPVRIMARSWGLLNWPSFETLGGNADWLYLPADGYVPVVKSRLAVTIHDVYKLEKPAPYEYKLDHYRARLRHKVIYRRIAANADCVLTVSKFTADRIMYFLKIPADKIHIINNGVCPVFYSPSEEIWNSIRYKLDLEDNEFYICIGGLKAKKNGRGIVETWKKFEERHNYYSLVIAGQNDPAILKAAKRDLKRVIYVEKLLDEELAALLAHSIALFFPSHYEGFGIPVIEACASGTLAVLSDIPALREVGRDVAIYVDPYEVDSMLNGLETCLKLTGERNDRIERGRNIAWKYTWDSCATCVFQALQSQQ